MLLVIGLILGGLAGAVFGNSFASVVAGLVIGGIVGAMLKYADRPRGAAAPRVGDAVAARLVLLEQRVSGLEKAMHRLVDAPALSPDAADVQPSQYQPIDPGVTSERAATAAYAPATASVDAPPPMPDYGHASPGAAPLVSATTPGVDAPLAPLAGAAAAPPVVPPTPPASKPNPLWQWITGGNVLARVGAVVLFIGVAFLARYAVEHVTVPVELRLTGIAVLGLALLGLGWRLRQSRRGYALTLQGAGIGVLYLTVFASLALYHLLPPVLAFVLLAALMAEAGVLAVRQDALALAVLGTLGGFAAPVLVSTGSGNHVVLFTFYAVLDAGIFVIAWFRPWRALNLLGFACTFIVGTAWGVLRYRPEDFNTTEPFLALFFLFYVGIAVAYALRRSLEVRAPIDGTLVFGTPLVTAGLQAALVRPYEYGMALSALAMAVVYIGLAYVLHARRRAGLRMLVDAFAALGLVFATLAIPLAVDARWTSATWALEGAALAWVGLRQRRLALRCFGLFLELAAAVAFVRGFEFIGTSALDSSTAVLNSRFIGGLLIAIAGVFTSWRYDAEREACRPAERAVAGLALAWGVLWWLGAGLAEIDRFAPHEHAVALAVGWLGLTSALLLLVARGLRFALCARPTIALLPALLVIAVAQAALQAASDGHLLGGLDSLAWAAGLAIGIVALRALERDHGMPAGLLAVGHVALLWLVVVLVAEESAWLVRVASERETWRLASWLLVPAGLTIALCKWRVPARWPFARWRDVQVRVGLGVVVLVLVAVALFANFTYDGDPAPLPYVPVLNPLDLTFAAIALAFVLWWREAASLRSDVRADDRWIGVAGGIAGFLWITMSTIRVVHHVAEVPFRADSLWQSGTVQAALALVWTTAALSAMVMGNRRESRAAWFAGAILLGVVVLKLLLVDLAHKGVAQIVSFMGVGLLLLLVAYLAPLPARRREDAA